MRLVLSTATMESRTKLRLPREQLESLARHALGARAQVVAVEELTKGMFNAAYALELAGHPPVVLKVAPPPDASILLTYEADIMRTEVDFYERVSREAACPVPKVLARDFSRSRIPADYFFMEKLRGAPLTSAKKRLSGEELRRVKVELGGIIGRLGVIRGTSFGYPQPGARSQAPSWRESFLKMVGNILDDAERFAVRLPRGTAALRALFGAHAGVLDEVREPVLTHFDLWEGNLFVHRVDGVPRIEAIIDGERAFWGDGHAEFVSAALFKDIEEEPDILRGWAEATGKPLEFTQPMRTRQALYRAYLYLLMVTEGAPRGYSGLVHTAVRQYNLHKLRGELKRLSALAGS